MQKTVVRNPNQSPIRRNLLNIAGITVQGETIAPQNGDRLLGGYGVAWLNNQDAASQTTRQDNPLPECNCGEGGGGGGGGGGGSDFPFIPCGECATLSESVDILAAGNNPCCIKGGQDCSTGTGVPVCVSDRCGSGYGQDCPPPKPPSESCETVVITYYKTTGMTTPEKKVYLLSTIDSATSDLENAMQQSIDSIQGVCGGGAVVSENTTTSDLSCNGIYTQITYVYSKIIKTANCGLYPGMVNLLTRPTMEQYHLGLQNWEKPSGKYLKNGKFYDACGLEPQDCITVCDENGVPYEICTDMNGKPKIEKKDT